MIRPRTPPKFRIFDLNSVYGDDADDDDDDVNAIRANSISCIKHV